MLFGLWAWVGSRNHVLHGGPDPRAQKSNFRGQVMPGSAQRHSAVICAKTAEPIKIPFGLWTLVCWRKLVLHGGHIDAPWWIRLNRLCPVAVRPYVKLLSPLVLICHDCCWDIRVWFLVEWACTVLLVVGCWEGIVLLEQWLDYQSDQWERWNTCPSCLSSAVSEQRTLEQVCTFKCRFFPYYYLKWELLNYPESLIISAQCYANQYML